MKTISDKKLFFVLLTILGFAIAALLAVLFIPWPRAAVKTDYGVTWSRRYASELGLDPDTSLATVLDDIGVRRFRLPAYWGLLEIKPGTWDFSYLDRDIAAIGKRNGKVILAIGEKLPRWPECWGPTWWKKLPRDQQRPLSLKYLKAVVEHFRNNQTVVAWQVENEPLFQYGDCPKSDPNFFAQETKFVRELDPSREITTTDSGELSAWLGIGPLVDALGVSVYRVVRNPLLDGWNFTYWWIPPYLYERKAALVRPFGVKGIYVSEFQMEPWSNATLAETPVADQLTSMNLAQMRSNFSYAERIGVPAVDFWGIEWWVWMKEKQGHPEFVDEARRFWKNRP